MPRLLITEKVLKREVDEGVNQKIAILGEGLLGRARVNFEESKTTIWIEIIHTDQFYRRRGYATRLLHHLAKKRKNIVCGSFLENGIRYLLPILPGIAKQYSVELDLNELEASKNVSDYLSATLTFKCD